MNDGAGGAAAVDGGSGGQDPGLPTIPGNAGPTMGPIVSLSANLERTGRHPVLIFGSAYAGKSSLLMSFIQALRSTRDLEMSLGEPVLDRADPKSGEKHQQAKRLFEWATFGVAQGKPIGATTGDPFFLPLDIKPRDSKQPPVKFAFLDGRGEQYGVNDDPEGDLFKALPPDIEDLLENFSYGITIIYIAPYSISDGHSRDTLDSDFGLLGAMSRYREHRRMRRNDFHLMLLTKWDQRALPMDSEPLFDQVSPLDVDRELRERYANAWGDFQGLALEGPARERRAFMQYTSGYFVNGQPRTPPAKFVDSFARYPRTLLNWLYGNATQFRLQLDDATLTSRRYLFDDVTIHTGRPASLTDWMASILTAR